MPDEDMLFDQPVDAFLADSNDLKWLQTNRDSGALEAVVEDPASVTQDESVKRQRHEMAATVQAVLASWDPNQGPAHEDEVRRKLEQSLGEIAQRTLAGLPAAERQSIRNRRKANMSYAYLFVASPDELELNAAQQQALAIATSQATSEAQEATRQEMNHVQIRNPQAYLAYKISRLYQETHQRRLKYGQEFYQRTLTKDQQARLKLSASNQ